MTNEEIANRHARLLMFKYDDAAMMRIMERVQEESIKCGPTKPWGAVLKLYPAWDGTLAMETVDGVRIAEGFRANDAHERKCEE